MEVPYLLDLFTNFNNVKYEDTTHTYRRKSDNKKFTSVTTFIGKFKKPFDEDYWAEYKANEKGVTKEEIKKEWKEIKDQACDMGSQFHLYSEQCSINKYFDFPDVPIVLKEQCNQFFENFYAKNNIVIKNEILVYDEEYQLAGQSDLLAYSIDNRELYLADYKTNKKIEIETPYESNRFLPPIEHISLTEYYTYCLQLSLYKYIIEKNTNVKLSDKMYILWFNKDNAKCKIFVCKYYKKEIELMLEYHKKNNLI